MTDANTLDQDQVNKEKSTALYLKGNYDFEVGGIPTTGNVGVRVIDTRYHAEAYGTDPSNNLTLQTKDTSRLDTLPSINATFALRKDLLLRAAASKTLGPVSFDKQKAAVVITNAVQREASAGNPGLKPFTSQNYDLSLENYYGRTGLATLGVFHKTVDGFIRTVQEDRVINGENYKVSTYANLGTSKINGAEIGVQQFFDALPAPFNGLGLQANYTYVDSKAANDSGADQPLEGLSKSSYNLVGMYERGIVKVRLAYNYRGKALVNSGRSIYSAPLGTLDGALSFELAKDVSLVFDAVNLLGAKAAAYFENPHAPAYYQPLNQRYGVQLRWSLGS